MMSPELQSKIALWRAKAAQGGNLSLEEMREAVGLLRGERKSAAEKSEAGRRKKAKKLVKSADQLLSELDNLGGIKDG